MYTVYDHISPSGKHYIGQTGRPVVERWGKDGKEYLKKCKNGKLHQPAFAAANKDKIKAYQAQYYIDHKAEFDEEHHMKDRLRHRKTYKELSKEERPKWLAEQMDLWRSNRLINN